MSDDVNTNEDMKIQRADQQELLKGPDECFIGDVYISNLFNAPEPARVGAAIVNFEPGARTNWHTHPLGQTLVVTKGIGWTQCEGGKKTEIRPGDIIWCNCGRRHWHGATATESMQHVAVQEALDGKAVDWQEPVTDDIYLSEDIVRD